MEILDKKSEKINTLFRVLDEIQEVIRNALKRRTLQLNGEKYLTNNEVSKLLKLSTRTLQNWRDNGTISYIQIKGRIRYRQSDVLKLLEDNFEKSWREE
ncbi:MULTISPECIES: helix-turn-helix domain-containing protein [Dysgonomonas]|uniref:Helix-turn-helix domain-containing protein n=1 Tax=Dysgonomonas gadei ATCC BAA-286 TaxID=742766 RepID=F5J3Y6_9BACT|nr:MULTISPECIES: helix-turn-helix domain-containing protein [Dysgonomonas]EGJ99557.1 hypothetical protein HMPREF9455_04053 [Dysgonomonas gadei ATCC BAA-286]MBF0650906.1 helix-turn-helix domain-containing protein [Dysgonomonas sp. GY75]